MTSSLFDATSRRVLMILAGIIILSRLHTLGAPQGVDVSVYSLAGQALLEGQSLYSGVWDHKPPAIYLAFAAALGFFSDFDVAFYVLGVLLAVLALPGVYAAASLWGQERVAGLWAAGFWAVASRDILLQADQPNGESFMNVFMVWSLALFLKPGDKGPRWSMAFMQGLLFFLASWFKPFSILHAGLLAIVYIVWSAREDRQKFAIQEVLLMVVIGALLWGATFLWFFLSENFNEFYEAVFVFNSTYPGNMFLNVLWGLEPGHLLHQSMFRVLPLFLMAGLAMALWSWRPLGRFGALCLAYSLAVIIMVALPGGYYPHYYQLWLPLIAVLSGQAVWQLGKHISSGALTANRLGAAVMAVLLLLQLPYYRLSAQEVSGMKYGKLIAPRLIAVEWIKQALLPNEQFYVWGFDPAVYWYSLKPPPTRFVGNTSLFQGPLKDKHFEELLFNFSNQPPELLVVSPVSPKDHPKFKWFEERYRQLQLPFIPNYRFYYLAGGALEGRLNAGGK